MTTTACCLAIGTSLFLGTFTALCIYHKRSYLDVVTVWAILLLLIFISPLCAEILIGFILGSWLFIGILFLVFRKRNGVKSG